MSTINPGEGWRLLRGDEYVIEGDEFLASNGQWYHATREGSQAALTYRRRISPPLPDDWIKTSERLPTKEDTDRFGRVLTFYEKSPFSSAFQAITPFGSAHNYSHWRRMRPDPVVEPKPQTADEAFNTEFANGVAETVKLELRRSWNAGVEWQKKQTQNPKPQ